MTQPMPVRRMRRSRNISVYDNSIILHARATIAHSLEILRDCQPATFAGRARDPMPAGDTSLELVEEVNSLVVPKAHRG